MRFGTCKACGQQVAAIQYGRRLIMVDVEPEIVLVPFDEPSESTEGYREMTGYVRHQKTCGAGPTRSAIAAPEAATEEALTDQEGLAEALALKKGQDRVTYTPPEVVTEAEKRSRKQPEREDSSPSTE